MNRAICDSRLLQTVLMEMATVELHPAPGTEAEKKHLVSFGDKARGRGVFFVQGASRQVKKMIAGSAVKIMVMILAGSFIQDSQIRVFDDFKPPGCHQQFQISIDGSLIQGTDPLTARLQDFLNPQGPVFF